MPIILSGRGLEDAIKEMHAAIEKARLSPCAKDQRGAAIFKDGELLGKGFNAPPVGFICSPRYCEPTCRNYTIHAEMNAITDAVLKGKYRELKGSRMYHAKVENGLLQDSRKPRCDCSKHFPAFGISEVVLKHPEGYTLYDSLEFFELSIEGMKNRKL